MDETFIMVLGKYLYFCGIIDAYNNGIISTIRNMDIAFETIEKAVIKETKKM